jgi:hypothetical protein
MRFPVLFQVREILFLLGLVDIHHSLIEIIRVYEVVKEWYFLICRSWVVFMLFHRATAVRAVSWIMFEHCVVVVVLKLLGSSAWKCLVSAEWISSPRQTILLVPWRHGFLIMRYYSTCINFCVWWLLTVFIFKIVMDLKWIIPMVFCNSHIYRMRRRVFTS